MDAIRPEVREGATHQGQLEGPPAGIETPRLAATMRELVFAAADDAAGLRRIVEAQAQDLVRLRRALSAARERLEMLREAMPPLPAEEASLPLPGHENRLPDAETLRGLIRSAQTDLEAVLRRSRWLRFGRRLGVAKPTAWEATDWGSSYTAPPRPGMAEPGLSELSAELARLRGLQRELGRSRWRRLGHRLRLSRPLPWDRELPTTPPAADVLRKLPEGSGTVPAIEHPDERDFFIRRFVEQCRAHAVDTILDVGANAGQFGRAARGNGWGGHIVSFEPQSAAHAELTRTAREDALWDVAERCAIGAADAEGVINIAGNSLSSSLLDMAPLHEAAAPQSRYSGREPCRVVTLDTFIADTVSDPTTLFGLKIDAQGYERQVLEGLRDHRHRVKVILCELSLAELYEGSTDFGGLTELLTGLGFRCIALDPVFEHPKTGRLLQADGLFIPR